MDECTINLAPYISRGWALKGSQPIAKTNYTRYRFHIIGIRTQRRFVFSFIRRQNQKAIIKFLKKLSKKYPRLVLFIDSAPWHKGKKIQAHLTNKKKTLRLYFFPPYSPELNIVEQHWKIAKQAISNRILRTIPATQYHLNNALTRKELMPKMFEYLIN